MKKKYKLLRKFQDPEKFLQSQPVISDLLRQQVTISRRLKNLPWGQTSSRQTFLK